MPTSTVCAGSTFGAKPPISASSRGSSPSSAASGMPWTLPLPSSRACSCRRARRSRSGRAAWPCRVRERAPTPRPIRRRGCDRRRGRSGSAPATWLSSACVVQRLADVARSRGRTASSGRPAARVSCIGVSTSPWSTHAMAERREALADARDADRRRPHVDAAPAAAEVERHADQVDAAIDAASALDGDRHALAARRDDGGEQIGSRLRRSSGSPASRSLVDDVVREEEPAAPDAREGHVEELLVVALPRVDEDEVERAGSAWERP